MTKPKAKSSVLLQHDHRLATVSDRTVIALGRAGIKYWDDLVSAAQDAPHRIKSVKGLGEKGLTELVAALAGARVEHALTTKRGKH